MKKDPVYYFGPPIMGDLMEYSSELGNTEWSALFPDKNKAWVNEMTIENNSNGFRCDDFIESGNHSGKHILFAGCSVTWGDALNKEQSWPWKVYEQISSTEKTSGYFNLGFCGFSIVQEILWMFKYFKKYGNPDTIFFLMPNVGRFVSIKKTNYGNKPASSIMKPRHEVEFPGSIDLVSYFSFELYNILDIYCAANNIKLISSSWSFEPDKNILGCTDEIFKNKFDSYFSIEELGRGESPKFMYEYMKSHPEAKIKAMDNTHPGEAHQAFYAYKMLEKYKELANEDIRV